MKSLDLQSRLLPASRNAGFRMEDYWVWDGSIIQGEDGRYHLFASRWPKTVCMHPGWLFFSEIVRAVSDTIEGPYQFEEVVFEPRHSSYFDGRMTHNPSIRKVGDRYLLFYIGVTYASDVPYSADGIPTEDLQQTDPWCREVWMNQRIGLATSTSVYGPWQRLDHPILEPRPGKWDCGTTTNPTPFVMKDGSIYLGYNSGHVTTGTRLKPFRAGVARAESWDQPFERISDKPVYEFRNPASFAEDPFLWHQDDSFHLIMKDLSGDVTGDKGSGMYMHSVDAVTWELGDPPMAYSRELVWEDGQKESVGNFERPQILFDAAGQPTHLMGATALAESHGDLQNVSDSWITVVPLRSGDPNQNV